MDEDGDDSLAQLSDFPYNKSYKSNLHQYEFMPRYGDSKTSKKQRKKSKRSEMIDNSEEPLKAYKMV